MAKNTWERKYRSQVCKRCLDDRSENITGDMCYACRRDTDAWWDDPFAKPISTYQTVAPSEFAEVATLQTAEPVYRFPTEFKTVTVSRQYMRKDGNVVERWMGDDGKEYGPPKTDRNGLPTNVADLRSQMKRTQRELETWKSKNAELENKIQDMELLTSNMSVAQVTKALRKPKTVAQKRAEAPRVQCPCDTCTEMIPAGQGMCNPCESSCKNPARVADEILEDLDNLDTPLYTDQEPAWWGASYEAWVEFGKPRDFNVYSDSALAVTEGNGAPAHNRLHVKGSNPSTATKITFGEWWASGLYKIAVGVLWFVITAMHAVAGSGLTVILISSFCGIAWLVSGALSDNPHDKKSKGTSSLGPG